MAVVNHFYDEVTTLKTTSSTTWQPISSDTTTARVQGSSLTASTKYLIVAKATMGQENSQRRVAVRVNTADDTNIAIRSESVIEPTYTATDDHKGYWFVGSYTTDASPGDVFMQVMTLDGGQQARMDQMILFLLDLDDLGSGNYVEEWNTSNANLTTTSWGTTLVNIPGANVADDTEYLVLGYAQIDVLDVKSNMHVRLRLDSDGDNTYDQVTYASEEGEDVDELRLFGFMGRALTNAAATIGMQVNAYADANNDWTKLSAYLIAIDISAFDVPATWYSYSASGVTITGLDTLESFSYTRNNDGNHLILGRFNYTTGGNDARTGATLEYGGSSVVPNDYLTYQTQTWDPKDAEASQVMGRENISSNQTAELLGFAHVSDSDPTSEYEFLAVLDLELAPGPPPFSRRQLTTVRM